LTNVDPCVLDKVEGDIIVFLKLLYGILREFLVGNGRRESKSESTLLRFLLIKTE